MPLSSMPTYMHLSCTDHQLADHAFPKALSLFFASQTENLIPSGAGSLAFARTPTEVLAIVYLGNASQPGGFFPDGVNGVIQG